ncbi:Serine-rich adhesin for platelets [Talaromyces islandicus]|uniref:Serine-rich adhesin for platelets n=1 Tax=Talaromyces islandicus TaxID=28573 RepID=A0A0U1M6R0_TALIS|nr:Serine-rich adhesin for platelets [Talaromyces islandicus]
MSKPYRAYPGNGGQLNPDSQGNQPVSFKTDINRKKTKKWVSAKSVSYDGDDWGDEDDEDDEEEEAPPPLPTSTSRFQANQPQSSASTPTNAQLPTSSEPLSSDTPAFVRPADIYKRMQEERAKETQPVESPSSAPIPPTAPPREEPSHQGNNSGLSTSNSPLVIPELKRLSGFGSDFMSGTSLSEPPTQPAQINDAQTQSQSLPLHHNPSLGFNSVVHQAFDVPETPTSSNDNFSRSNSDSTNVISPILSHGNLEPAKTPTITEDYAGEASAQEPPANFKPGHRRDLSLPSPGNGPDRVPIVANSELSQQAELVSSSNPGDNLAQSADHGQKSPPDSEGTASGEATPKPASDPQQSIESAAPVESQPWSQNKESQSPMPTQLRIPQDQTRDVTQINPSMSTETSPQDMESDRLRKEIMRSLSPDPTTIEDASHTGNESTFLPKEYDSYLNDHRGVPLTSPLQPKSITAPAGPTEPLSLTINPAMAAESSAKHTEASSAVSQSHSGLKKRFSWEASDDSDEEDVLEEQPERPTSIPPAHSPSIAEDPSISKTAMRDGGDAPDEQGLPRYSTIANETTHRPEDTAPEVVEPAEESSLAPLQEVDPSAILESPSVDSPAPSTVQREPTQPAGTEASLPSFRKIMEIPSGDEKIRVFKDTREQFARIDNGLEDWIRRSSESLPEHADLIRANGRLPGGAPTGVLPPRNKFPKLSSLGNLSLPSSHEGSSQLGQNVEAKGKDFLHSAGVFGGKAGGAARGLFAKGKSKLRVGADKGKSSIFSGRRRSSQLSNDALSSDIDVTSVKSNPPASPSTSSRYSLQPVPRIPSFKFSGSRSFTSPSLDDGRMSPIPRAMSLDWGKQLKPLPEEVSPISRPGSSSSLRKAMMQFNLDENAGDVRDSGDLYSAYSHPSPRKGSFSIGGNDSQKEGQDTNSAVQGTVLGFENSRLNTVGAMDSLQRQLTALDVVTGASLSAVSSLSHDINQKSISAGSDAVSPRSLSPLHGEWSKRFSEDVAPPLATRGSSLEVSRDSNSARNSMPPRIHHISRFYRSGSTDQTSSASTQSVSKPNLDKVTSHERHAQGPVSPPLPHTTGLKSQYNDRRLSSDSQVSDMSKDEMDRIREKFDEDALYTQARDPSPTGSKVSALSEDQDKDLDAILEEKLGEAGLEEDLKKSQAMQQPRRASAPRRSSQPISVVRLSRLPQERRVSQSAESVKRYSRFSFESDRNALAEAMLVTGYGKARLVDSSREPNMASQVPETLGEEAPDEPPPPFDDPQAPYRPDEKDATVDERTSLGHNETPGPHVEYGLTEQNPPQYQPLRSHPLNSKPAQRENLFSPPHAHRDSHHSSISSLSNAVTNNNAPLLTIYPEPRLSRSKQHGSFDPNSQMPKTIEHENLVPQPSQSRWTDSRLARGTETGSTGNNSQSAGSGNLFGPGRREEDSFGSGDSMAVQAALSRNDLRAEPSPLHQESETASATSGNSFKVSVPFKNKIKFVGKRARGSSIDTPAAEEPAGSKAADKPKKSDKKVEGKRGPFNKISGIFNRPNPNQRVKQAEAKSRSSLNDLPPRDTQQVNVTWQRSHTLHASPTATAASQNVRQHSSPYPAPHHQPQQASLPNHGKGLPPPPGGYYAPSPPMDALQYPGYPPHPDTVGTYQPTYEQSYPTKTAHTFYAPEERHSRSSHSYSVGSPVSGSGSMGWHDASSPPEERGRNRAQDLRLRSRSPRSQPIRPADRYNHNVNYSDPIYHLGKFHAVTETPRIGDQSTPFPITLPDGMDRDQLSPRNSIQPEHLADIEKAVNPGLGLRPPGTTVQSVANYSTRDQASSRNPLALHMPQQHQYMPSPNESQIAVYPSENTQRGDRDQYYDDRSVVTKNVVPVELPVPRDDSSEEVVMSSTAYPGQEWQPSGYYGLTKSWDTVTGAGRGLGKEFLTAFALSGAKGACIDLSLPSATSSIDHITKHIQTEHPQVSTPTLKPYACDVTSESQVERTISSIVSDFGQIDVLVTAAGIVDNVPAEEYSYERWRKMLDINLDGTFLCAREVGKHMMEKKIKGGSIILVGSICGSVCVKPQKQSAYNASKGAVIMLAKSLATEWAPHSICVNSLSPGYMRTDLILDLLDKEGSELVDSWVEETPMRRIAHPSELRGTVVWIASEASSFLTGSDVIVDGGYTAY